MIYAEKIELCIGRISLLHSSIFFRRLRLPSFRAIRSLGSDGVPYIVLHSYFSILGSSSP